MKEKYISAELTALTEFAGREDWLYQAELRLADEFSGVAMAFVKANPGTEVICKYYIGSESALRYSARTSILRSIKSIKRSLDELQGHKNVYIAEDFSGYFTQPSPAQTFLQSEIHKRSLDTLLG